METLISWFSNLEFWSWWILGLLLIILEILAPGTFFLWLGIAAGVVGLVAMLFPALSWEYEWILFAVIAVVSIIVSKRFLSRGAADDRDTVLNERGARYIGRKFTLAEAIRNGRGSIRVDDTQWIVEGDDLDAGTTVIVTGVAGNRLTVKPEE